ncbi:MAG: Exodeoxyribonuclease 7 large subunit [Verrucomicrobiaceae bacterium]|nr:Exodeoxyribonuclease 7 large subunit [Verrucomicrobiaceae bacterium]
MPEADNILSVSQLTRQIRTLLEGTIGEVWVQGEISNHRLQTSGHQYFTLKDAGAQVSCVMFRGAAMRSSARLGDGVQVQIFGELSVYEPRGQYQLVVKTVQPKGQGVLQAKFEALKRRLYDEGIFDDEHKRLIPKFPGVIALITSPTGAAIRDMLNILARRAPWVRLMVYPVRVQGQGAEVEIAKAIEALNRAEDLGLPRPDTIVVGRGGGSLEDLWNFNEEIVARAIFASTIPIVSAVGHEIDFTIADFTADLRAPTPSAAAELIAPDIIELRRHFEAVQKALKQKVLTTLDHHAQVIELTAKGALLREPRRLLLEVEQSVDELDSRWRAASRDTLRSWSDNLVEMQQVLARYHPARVVSDAGHRVTMTGHRLSQAVTLALRNFGERAESKAQTLKLLGPESILSRGFSYTTDANGKVLTDATEVKAGDIMVTRLAQGTVRSTAT